MPLALPLPHRSCDRAPIRLRAPARRGLTLLELVVVLGMLGVMMALVAPAILGRVRSEATLAEVLAGARANAVARAQTLDLVVEASGDWWLRALPPDDSLIVQRGRIATRPAIDFVLRISALGACIPRTALPDEIRELDAASCRVPVRAEAP
jgi:prepilin-type N-terminal cleavage/methylation domain-containing protein